MATAIFQGDIEQVICDDTENIVCYQDNICIEARNETEPKKNCVEKITKCENENKP